MSKTGKELEKCPHCRRGNLTKTPEWSSWDYNCDVCSRGWIVLDGKYWLACFDAGGHVYEVVNGEFEDRNGYKYQALRQALWERVKKGEHYS